MSNHEASVAPLIPPDPLRCQTEWLGGSFMTFGPRQMERCKKPVDFIVFEGKPDSHGRHGSMGLCEPHLNIFETKEPKKFKTCIVFRKDTV